jgi:hypothetical protein
VSWARRGEARGPVGEAGAQRLDRTFQRVLPEDYCGPVFTWDIDKTYLATEIHSWRGLIGVPFEFAIDKRDIAGTAALLQALRRGMAPPGLTEQRPVLFVSASPPELRRVIERKMLLDGVEFDGITFKDQLGLLLRGRLRALREQVGYKLAALLMNRRDLPPRAEEYLFGDDSESDATIYALYGDICAGRLRGRDLGHALTRLGVAQADTARIGRLAANLPQRDSVRLALINLEVHKRPERFTAYGRTAACFDSLQMSLVLHERGLLPVDAVLAVAAQMARQFAHRQPNLMRSVSDALLRRLVTPATVSAVWDLLRAHGLAPDHFTLAPPADSTEAPPLGLAPHGAMTPATLLGLAPP